MSISVSTFRNVKCHGIWMSNVIAYECQMSNVKCHGISMSNVKCQMSNVKCHGNGTCSIGDLVCWSVCLSFTSNKFTQLQSESRDLWQIQQHSENTLKDGFLKLLAKFSLINVIICFAYIQVALRMHIVYVWYGTVIQKVPCYDAHIGKASR